MHTILEKKKKKELSTCIVFYWWWLGFRPTSLHLVIRQPDGVVDGLAFDWLIELHGTTASWYEEEFLGVGWKIMQLKEIGGLKPANWINKLTKPNVWFYALEILCTNLLVYECTRWFSGARLCESLQIREFLNMILRLKITWYTDTPKNLYKDQEKKKVRRSNCIRRNIVYLFSIYWSVGVNLQSRWNENKTWYTSNMQNLYIAFSYYERANIIHRSLTIIIGHWG